MNKKKIFAGVDVGTQGVRLVLVDEKGEEYFGGDRKFKLSDENRIRQDPEMWWLLLNELFADVINELGQDFYSFHSILSIGVTSTSGTIVPLNKNKEVLYGAIMYSDPESQNQSVTARKYALDYYGERPGSRILTAPVDWQKCSGSKRSLINGIIMSC